MVAILDASFLIFIQKTGEPDLFLEYDLFRDEELVITKEVLGELNDQRFDYQRYATIKEVGDLVTTQSKQLSKADRTIIGCALLEYRGDNPMVVSDDQRLVEYLEDRDCRLLRTAELLIGMKESGYIDGEQYRELTEIAIEDLRLSEEISSELRRHLPE